MSSPDTSPPDSTSISPNTTTTTTTPTDPPPPTPKHAFPKSQVSKLWDAFGDDRANELPNVTATGRLPSSATVGDGIRTLKWKDFGTLGQKPCVRDSLLMGIGAGFAVGGVRGIVGGRKAIWPACNFAVATFALSSFFYHEYCQHTRRVETQGMAEAVVLMRQLKEKKRIEAEEVMRAKEVERLQKEEEQRRKSWTRLGNYKFW